MIFPLRREGNPARAETAPPEGGTIGKTTFAPAKAKKEGSAGVRSLFLYKENPRIVRGFKKGFADEQKRAEEKAITIRQKRGGKARIEKQAEN